MRVSKFHWVKGKAGVWMRFNSRDDAKTFKACKVIEDYIALADGVAPALFIISNIKQFVRKGYLMRKNYTRSLQ